jgi:DNA primase
MRFPDSLLAEIKARIPISEIVGRRVKLRKQGREWAGLSPFNAEKTPSFFVNDQKAFYHDFSSGKHGDIFTFVMETEGLSFPEAVERLAAQAGLALPLPTPEVREREEQRQDLYTIVDLACRYFEAKLQASQPARDYLAQRGVLVSTQTEFRLGFAPDSRDGLKRHLMAQGVTPDQMSRCGLIVTPPDDGRPHEAFDRFRHRLMIPIQDTNRRVVGFGGRTLAPDGKPKYLNSPATDLFHKGELVFNTHRARPAAHETGTVLVVEGYLDAIAVWQAGFAAVVATLGTAFTEGQIEALWRIAREPIICFDGDRAGFAAATRAIDRILPLLKTGNSFHFAYLPLGRDPDDLVRSGGLEALQQVLAAAKPLWDVLWGRETAATAIATPDQRAVLEKRLFEVIQTIGDTRIQRYYRDQVRQSLRNLFYQYDRSQFDRGPKLTGRPTGKRTDKGSGKFAPVQMIRTPGLMAVEKTRHLNQEKIFLGLCVEFPEIVASLLDPLSQVRLQGSDQYGSYDDFLHEIIRIHHEHADLGPDAFYHRMTPPLTAMLEELHGQGGAETGRGHRLMQRFPVLRTHPPTDFIARSVAHFMDNFLCRDLEDEIRALTALYPNSEEEAFEGRLNAQRAGLLALKDRLRAEESALAEEAGNLKAVTPATEGST